MASRRALGEDEVEAFVAGDPAWRVVDGRLHREFRFEDFVGAFRFMAGSALVAERLDHHPTWSNTWNRVTVDLWTHTTGGLTELDLELARTMSRLAA